MGKHPLVLALTLLGSVMLAATQSYDNVSVRNGRLELATAATAAVADDFTRDSGQWQPFMNFDNIMRFAYTADGLKMTNGIGKECDTAWSVKSKPVDIPTGATRYTVRVGVRSALDFWKLKPLQTYANAVYWLDELDVPVGSAGSTFSFISAGEFPAFTTLTGIVPKRARKAVLSIGGDNPNAIPDMPMTIRHLSLSFADSAQMAFAKEGTFIAGPYAPVDTYSLDWEADVPTGTSIALQIGHLTENGTLKFVGPDGTSGSWYTEENRGGIAPQGIQFAHVYYIKARLTGDGTATPSVKAIAMGGHTVLPFVQQMRVQDVATAVVTLKSAARSAVMTEPVVLSVTDEIPVLWDKMTVQCDGQDITGAIVRYGDELRYCPASGRFAEGVHEIRLWLANASGGRSEFARLFYRGTQEVPAENRVTVRDDGMTLVGGKPFFPIGMYSVCKREFNGNDLDRAFAVLKENGFNTAQTYGDTHGPVGEEFFSAAEKYGFKVFAYRGPVADMATKMMRKSFLAWYIGDDTSSNQVPEALLDIHSGLKAIDPWHVTCQADTVGDFNSSRYRPFVQGSDALLPEIYPVQKDTAQTKAQCVPQAIQDMRTFWNDVKVTNENLAKLGRPPVVRSCWAIIQHFKGWGCWERFPTERELRAMSYGAIAAGAHGITWYTYAGFVRPKENMYNYGVTSSPEVWKQVTTISRELNRLYDVLCERPVTSPKTTLLAGPVKDALGNPSLTVLAKRHEGKTYVLVVNSTLETVKAAFEPETPAAVREWFADKPVAPAGTRRFEADFTPYGVRLFVLE